MFKRLWILLLFSAGAFASEEAAPVRPPNQEITPKGQTFVQNGVAMPYLSASLIYWKAREDGLQYIVTGQSGFRGRVYEPNFEGHLGFKAGLGVNLGHDGWDVYFQYTWFQSDATDRFHRPIGEELLGTGFLLGGVESSHANWDFHINVFDLEWARLFYVSPYLMLRPFFGLKGYCSDQDYHVKSEGFSDVARTVRALDRIWYDVDQWGMGIRGGLQNSFCFTKNFSIFGNLALAAEWSRYRVRLQEEGASALVLRLKNERYQMVPVLELAVGLRWDIWFYHEKFHFGLEWGWEEQMWWDFAHAFDLFNRGLTGGNLNFQGLTVRARLDF